MNPESYPRISFIIIVLNGMPFIECAIRSVYPHAHEVIIVEGAVRKCLFAANSDGSSVDGTVEAIKSFPDPSGKITLVQGVWPEKLEMQNKALEFVSGDYVWLVDADEIYKDHDIEEIISLLAEDRSIARIDFIPVNFWKGFEFEFISERFQDEQYHYRRVFRFSPGARFVSHRPPTLEPGEGYVISGLQTRRIGVFPYHYSYVYWTQVYQKVELYHRYGWGGQWGLDLDEWYREMFLRWTPENRKILEQHYPVWTGDTSSYTLPFTGEHPRAVRSLLDHPPSYGTTEISVVPEQESLEIIGSSVQQRRTLSSLNQLVFKGSLDHSRETIGAHLTSGRPFWNIHVSLTFISSSLNPDSYLEIWSKNGDSLIQVLHNSRPRTATIIADGTGYHPWLPWLPKILRETKGQIREYKGRTGCPTDICYFRGNSRRLLKGLVSKGCRYDLIALHPSSEREDTWQDLEEAIELLSYRGVIVLDGLLCSGYGKMVTLLHRLRLRYPDLSIISNTVQDRGCALILKNIDVEKLLSGDETLFRMKVAEESTGAGIDLTSIEAGSHFSRVIGDLFREVRPRKIIETGTYNGTGTTKIIASLLRELRIDHATFFSIECNRDHHAAARRNLEKEGLQQFVRLRHGLSLPRRMLLSRELIREKYVNQANDPTVYVDHEEGLRAARYHAETAFNTIKDDCLGDCLKEFSGAPDFVLLDSGGHIGNVEFNYLIDRLSAPCYIALDDIDHVKHRRSYRQICKDPRFELLTTSAEKFGFCLSRFVPDAQKRPVRLLWIRTDSIGDSVLSLGLLAKLKKLYPVAWVTVVCQEVVGELYSAQPYVDEVITVDRQRAYIEEGYRAALVEWLQELQADYCYCPMYSREELVDILALGSGAGQVIAFAGDDSSHHFPHLRNRMSDFYGKIVEGSGNGSELQRYEEFLAQAGGKTSTVLPSLEIPSEAMDFAGRLFAEHGLERDKTLAFFPGAQHRCRETTSYGPALDKFCKNTGWSVIALGSQQDSGIINENLKHADCRWVNLAGETTLLQAAALLSLCRLALGAETGLGHIAAAIGIPNVLILGGGHFGRFFPNHGKSIAVSLPLACYGCNWSCRFKTYPCVASITPGTIGQALDLAMKEDTEGPLILLQLQADSEGHPQMKAPEWSLSGLRVVGERANFMVVGPEGAVPFVGIGGKILKPPVVTTGKVTSGTPLASFDLKRLLAVSGVSLEVNPVRLILDRLRIDRMRGIPFTETLRSIVRYAHRWFSHIREE